MASLFWEHDKLHPGFRLVYQCMKAEARKARCSHSPWAPCIFRVWGYVFQFDKATAQKSYWGGICPQRGTLFSDSGDTFTFGKPETVFKRELESGWTAASILSSSSDSEGRSGIMKRFGAIARSALRSRTAHRRRGSIRVHEEVICQPADIEPVIDWLLR